MSTDKQIRADPIKPGNYGGRMKMEVTQRLERKAETQADTQREAERDRTSGPQAPCFIPEVRFQQGEPHQLFP